MKNSRDRRKDRRQAAIGEILDAALELMAQDGVAGMSLSSVARAVGMKPPSLYVYFPAKMALYDAIFERASKSLTATVVAAGSSSDHADDPVAALLAGAHAHVDWLVRHPVEAQLLIWRPVPGFIPTPTAYAPSLELVGALRARLSAAVEQGRLLPAAASDDSALLLVSLVSGIVSQHLANHPGDVSQSPYIRLLGPALDMWLAPHTP